jgi:hypothetical protein
MKTAQKVGSDRLITADHRGEENSDQLSLSLTVASLSD